MPRMPFRITTPDVGRYTTANESPYSRKRGGLQGILRWLQGYEDPTNEELGQAFIDQYGSQYDWLNDVDPNELGAYLESYFEDSNTHWLQQLITGDIDTLDMDDILRDLDEIEKYQSLEMPVLEDANTTYQKALATINQENAEIEAMYDQLLSQQRTGYQQQLQDVNRAYGDYRQQVLGNQYAQNAQLLGTAQSTMSRARQRALEAGASAGVRLAGNVNTLLSMQNQQASQSLQTSNNLAQMLLNQQQAAAGIRGDFQGALASDTSRRADLRRGSAERANAYGNSMLQTNQSIYDQQMQQWENDFDTNLGNNPFADVYRQQLRKQSSKQNKNSLGY